MLVGVFTANGKTYVIPERSDETVKEQHLKNDLTVDHQLNALTKTKLEQNLGRRDAQNLTDEVANHEEHWITQPILQLSAVGLILLPLGSMGAVGPR